MVLTISTREEGVSLPALLGSGAKSSALLLSWRGSRSPRGSSEGPMKARLTGFLTRLRNLSRTRITLASRGILSSKMLRQQLGTGL